MTTHPERNRSSGVDDGTPRDTPSVLTFGQLLSMTTHCLHRGERSKRRDELLLQLFR